MEKQYNKIDKLSLVREPSGLPVKRIRSSTEVNEYIRLLFPENELDLRESFYALFMNNSNQPVGFTHMSTGTVTGTVVDPKWVMSIALQTMCTGMIIAHNHPSGNLKPSNADRKITNKLQKACSYFDIRLHDHLIITKEGGYYSFADQNDL